MHPTTLSGANIKKREGCKTGRPFIPETIYVLVNSLGDRGSSCLYGENLQEIDSLMGNEGHCRW